MRLLYAASCCTHPILSLTRAHACISHVLAQVAFNGKGFEGSWAAATVVKPDGKKHVLVRYTEFVDNDGTPLVEQIGIERLRLPPPPAPEGWVPQLGQPVEGLWNDCWWEGSVREFHVYAVALRTGECLLAASGAHMDMVSSGAHVVCLVRSVRWRR